MTFLQSIMFWFAPLALAAGAFALLILGLLVYGFVITYKQWRCQHKNWYETQSCNAQCSDCGKDLGFIGAWRKRCKA